MPPPLVAALEDSFRFSPLIGVIGVMADKDYEGLLAEFEPVLAHVVCTQNSTDASMPAADAGRGRPRDLRPGPGQRGARRWPTRIDQAAALAEAGGAFGEAIGSGGVLVTGSVVTVGEARAMLRSRRDADGAERQALMQRRLCAAILLPGGDRLRAEHAGADLGRRRSARPRRCGSGSG